MDFITQIEAFIQRHGQAKFWEILDSPYLGLYGMPYEYDKMESNRLYIHREMFQRMYHPYKHKLHQELFEEVYHPRHVQKHLNITEYLN